MPALIPLLLSGLLAAITLPAHAAGCEYDTQCKGDRICEAGICISPPAPLPPPPPRVPRAAAAVPEPVVAEPETPREPPTYCCTSMGKLGPYDLSRDGQAAKLLDACMGKYRNGVDVPGKACY